MTLWQLASPGKTVIQGKFKTKVFNEVHKRLGTSENIAGWRITDKNTIVMIRLVAGRCQVRFSGVCVCVCVYYVTPPAVRSSHEDRVQVSNERHRVERNRCTVNTCCQQSSAKTHTHTQTNACIH